MDLDIESNVICIFIIYIKVFFFIEINILEVGMKILSFWIIFIYKVIRYINRNIIERKKNFFILYNVNKFNENKIM